MLRRGLVILLLLALSARADEIGLFALRVGDFQNARPASRLERAYVSWGLGRWDEALELSVTDTLLSARLLAVSASQHAGRPISLDGLEADAPGARGKLQRFLLASYRAEQDWRERELSREELERRARAAFAHLDQLEVDRELISNGLAELPLAADEIAGFWLQRLGPGAYRLYEERFKALLDFEPGEDWGSMGIYYQVMSLSHQVSIAAVMEQHRAGLRDEDDVLRQLTALALRLDAALQDQSNANKRMVAQGFLGASSSRVHRALANLVVGRPPGEISPVEAAFLTDHLNAAYQSALRQQSPKVLIAVQTDLLQALWAIQRPGWEQTMEEFLSVLVPRWETERDRAALIVAYASQGRLRFHQNRAPEAIRALEQAIALLEATIQESGGQAVGDRLRREWRDVYELLARLQLEASKPEEAAATLDRLRQLDTLSRFNLRDLSQADPDVEKVARLQSRLGSLEAQSADSALIASSRADYYAALARLQEREPGYLRLSVRPNLFASVQASLPSDTVLVQLFPTPDKLYLFVATREQLKIREVRVTTGELEAAVTRFRRQVMQFARDPGKFSWSSDSGQGLLEPLLVLGGAILTPLGEDLKEKTVVAFVPTGSLSYFPFQVLALPGPRFLIEDKVVVVLPKAADLELLDRPTAPDRGTLVALGDPDGTLPSAREEARDLARLFPGARTFLGPEATAARLHSPQASYLHLATHGIVHPTAPMQSYLVLAGAPLRVLDVAGLDLRGLRLVTLSACQSALAQRSPEVGWELFSLADAFGFAGSPSLVASLWKVDDAATRTMMASFYRGLQAGRSRGQALRLAQLEMLRDPAVTHPFYWAGFELIGDWR